MRRAAFLALLCALACDEPAAVRSSSIGEQSHRLAVSVSGAGAVTSAPAGLDCGATCSETMPSGTSVALTATPAAGWSFAGWDGDCTGSGGCTVTMDVDRSVTARFQPIPPPPPPGQRALTVTVQGNGRVVSRPAAIDCTDRCTANFPDGAQVTLTGSAASGWQLSAWSGACSSAICALTLSADASVAATFTELAPPPPPPPPPVVSVSISPETAGLLPGATQQFRATLSGTNDTAVAWGAPDGGAVSATGFYTAPATVGSYRVVVTSHADPSKIATATVMVLSPPPPRVTVSISPLTLAIPSNSNWRLTATVTGASDTNVIWSAPDGGTVDSTGLFNTPLASGRFRVVATSNADPTASATAVVRTDTPLVDHGGQILPSVAVYAIWWGTQFADAPAQIKSLFEGLNGSAYLKTLDQYMRGATASVSFMANLLDTSSPPSVVPTTTQLGQEICKVLDANSIAPRADGYYAVFVDNNPANSATGWHWQDFCHGVQITIAFHVNPFAAPNNDGPDACGRTQTMGVYSNTALHELAESMTDPLVVTWYDPLDHVAPEIADRCPLPVFTCNVTLANGIAWRLEPLWSNDATACVFGTP